MQMIMPQEHFLPFISLPTITRDTITGTIDSARFRMSTTSPSLTVLEDCQKAQIAPFTADAARTLMRRLEGGNEEVVMTVRRGDLKSFIAIPHEICVQILECYTGWKKTPLHDRMAASR